jgi:hypothetical protein
MAAESLKGSIEFTVRQLKAEKVNGEMKIKWSRALVRQVEALCARAIYLYTCRYYTDIGQGYG